MYMKVHRSPAAGDVLAVCDQELLNTTLDNHGLPFPIHASFYGDRPASDREVQTAMLTASCINLVGKKAFACARSLQLVEEKGCLLVSGVPHAQIYRI